MSSTPFPTWTPQTRTNGAGHFTREQWAIVDSEKVNERHTRLQELRETAAAAERDGRATARMLRASANRAAHTAERSLTFCTNSGMLRTECNTCDHTRQLRELEAAQLGDAVGRIAGLTAGLLHNEFPHLDLEQLLEAFTRPVAAEGIARRYVAALESGATPGEAAGKASTALIHAWKDARLAAKAAAKAARTA